MPFAIRKAGEKKYEVITKDTGHVHGTFETEDAAKEQLAALYAGANPAKEKADGPAHFDAGELGEPEETPEGFLRVPARLARTGILEYRNPDGSVRRELVTPDVLFDPESLASHRMRPVLDDHPWSLSPPLISAENARHFQRGSVGETVRRAGNFVEAPLMITDAELIRKIKGGMRQVSLGYEAPTVAEDGVWNGQKYTHRQLKRRVNHVAILPKGRAGDDVQLRLDAAERGIAIGRVLDENATVIGGDRTADLDRAQDTQREQTMPFKIKVDGIEVEFANEQGAQIVERALQARADSKMKCDKCDAAMECPKCGKAKADAAAALEAAQGESKKQLDKLQAQIDSEKARADAAEKALADAKKAHADAQDPAKLQEKIRARVALEQSASPHLPKEFKVDGASDLDVKKAVLKTLCPELDLATKTDGYVEARFDAEIERAGKSGLAAARVATAVRTDGTRDDKVDADAARARMMEDQANLFRKPVGATTKGRTTTDAE